MEDLSASVIVPVHNGAEALPTWLVHIEQQSFPTADFEILVADCGSADDSVRVAERHAAGAPVRTRCLRLASGGMNAARNWAAREARGRHLFFLDLDLVAGPGWMEAMLRAQEASERGLCAMARIGRHPQLSADAFTRWFLPESRTVLHAESMPHPLECSPVNLCVPRRAFLEAGALEEAPGRDACAGANLARRLESIGVGRAFIGDACVYIWRAAHFAEERRRCYALGHALYGFGQETGFSAIHQRFRVTRNPFRGLLDLLAIPLYVRACEDAEEGVGGMGIAYRRVLRHDLHRGYHDARRGLPMRMAPPAG